MEQKKQPLYFAQSSPGRQILPSYSLVNGDENEIVFGSSMPLSGGVSILGRDFTYGVNLVFNKLNRSGGIGGTLVKLASQNDWYDPAKTVQVVNLLQAQTSVFLGILGAENLLAIMPQIKSKQMAMFFPAVGNKVFRKNAPDYMVHYRASMKRELDVLITYVLKALRRRKIAVFYEANRWGEGAVQEVESILAKHGLTVYSSASYPAGTVNVLPAARSIAKTLPDAVICIAQARPAYNFIQQVVNEGLYNASFLGLGELAPIQPIIKKSRGVELILSSVVPDPWRSELGIAKQFRRDMKKHLPNRKISQFLFEGYLAGSVMTNILKRTKKPPTLGNVLEQFERLKNVNFGGISLDFNASDRSLCKDVWINTGGDKAWPRFVSAAKKVVNLQNSGRPYESAKTS
ncbi:ABC transporter substrate-binding protein [Candidatus Babeliales bacterium]|nr:ABC transporter substrate-binding protein [Candidatus Babeliales bacterium]